MPVQRCEKDGKPGYKWGQEGFCYTYTPGDDRSELRARDKAEEQGRAIEANQNRKEK